MNGVSSLTKQQRAELGATRNATEKQRIALGARLIHHQLRRNIEHRGISAAACIRLQTWY